MHLLFTVALDNGEIWELNNKEVRFCKNISMEREKINKEVGKSEFLSKPPGEQSL
jgi:hypothetical protein